MTTAIAGSERLAHHTAAELRPAPGRVIGRLFLPGDELRPASSRAVAIVERVLALAESDVEVMAADLVRDFSTRHPDYAQLLAGNAAMVSSHIDDATTLSPARTIVLGASFTMEYAVEGAALCNPSTVIAPDQDGLLPGQLRVAVSLRGIGEGHLSSIGFATAVVGPGADWVFEPREMPLVTGVRRIASWRRKELRAALNDVGEVTELAHAVLAALPDPFDAEDLGRVLIEAQQNLFPRPGLQDTADMLRSLVASAYEVDFPVGSQLSSRTLMPGSAEESNGIEDARFVQFTDADGSVQYRATYTAYDGLHIAPRLLTSPDLRVFRAQRLTGPAARNKGMALFPRLIGGRHYSLCRSDGESTYLSSSTDGLRWGKARLIRQPQQSWEILQVGNCGSPIETPAGWLVLTHGVGPMRVYRIGAMLLDLDDPSRVLGHLEQPLLQGENDEREGYVPNVVYSCGGLVHDGRLWLPYGIGDARIAVAWVDLADLLAAMSPGPG